MTTTETMPASQRAALPAHVPEHLVFDFDMYNPPGVPDVVWTRHNGGHWIATRGQLIRSALED